MRRFSGLFWITALAGGLSSLLLTFGIVCLFHHQAGAMITLCRQGRTGCGSVESLQHLFRMAVIAQGGGTILLFGLAHAIGHRLLRPQAQAAGDARP